MSSYVIQLPHGTFSHDGAGGVKVLHAQQTSQGAGTRQKSARQKHVRSAYLAAACVSADLV